MWTVPSRWRALARPAVLAAEIVGWAVITGMIVFIAVALNPPLAREKFEDRWRPNEALTAPGPVDAQRFINQWDIGAHPFPSSTTEIEQLKPPPDSPPPPEPREPQRLADPPPIGPPLPRYCHAAPTSTATRWMPVNGQRCWFAPRMRLAKRRQ